MTSFIPMLDDFWSSSVDYNPSPWIAPSIAGQPRSAQESVAVKSLHHRVRGCTNPYYKELSLSQLDLSLSGVLGNSSLKMWQFCSCANQAPRSWELLCPKTWLRLFWKYRGPCWHLNPGTSVSSLPGTGPKLYLDCVFLSVAITTFLLGL